MYSLLLIFYRLKSIIQGTFIKLLSLPLIEYPQEVLSILLKLCHLLMRQLQQLENNNQMQDENDLFQEEDILQVLDIFPKRKDHSLSLKQQSYTKLYQELTCPLCHQLLKNPVYLRCSHRFCKSCIEKHVRTHSSVSKCPKDSCKGEFINKNNLKNDYNLDSFIGYTFDEPVIIRAAMEHINKSQVPKNKSLELRRLESQPENRSRVGRGELLNQDSLSVPQSMKRARTAGDGEEGKRKRKSASQKKIQSKAAIQKEEKQATPARRSRQSPKPVPAPSLHPNPSKPQVPKPQIPIKAFKPVPEGISMPTYYNMVTMVRSPKSAKKKNVNIIQIDSDSPQPEKQIKEIRREEFLHVGGEKDNPQVNNKNANQLNRGVQGISKMEAGSEKNLKKQKIQQAPMIAQPEPMEPEEDPKVSQQRQTFQKIAQDPQVKRALELLKQQFGQTYKSKVIELTDFPFYAQVDIQKYPDDWFTPQLVRGTFQLNLQSQLSAIAAMLSSFFNLEEKFIKILTFDYQVPQKRVQLSPKVKLVEINEKYWKNWTGIQLFEISQALSEERKASFSTFIGKNAEKTKRRTLYYIVDLSQISS